MGNGIQTCKKPIDKDVMGYDMEDPFFDSYQEEILEGYDILNRLNDLPEKIVLVKFHKDYLYKIVKHYLNFVQELERKTPCL